MAFQLPHHFEALRCMALERLWDGQQGREPMHDLMGDILEYCRKPALTLGCYQEEILIDEWPSNDFAFVDCGVMYQVSAKNGAIRLYRTCAVEDGVPETTEVSTLYSSTLYGEVCKCYHDGDTRKLYVMYRKSDSRYHTRASDCVLIKHDLPSGKTEAPIVFPNLGSSNGSLAGIIVVGGDWLYVVVEFELQNQSCDYSTEMKMFSVRLSMSSRVRFVCTVPATTEWDGGLIRFGPVPGSPHAVDLFYTKSDSTWHSLRIGVIRTDNPTLFSVQSDAGLVPQKLTGNLVRNTPGLGQLMMSDVGGGYVLRHPRGLREAATIDKNGITLSEHLPMIFGRWSYCYSKSYGNNLRALVRCHPYLLL